jgi:FtsP/CotA-like multicopper oxidase with cupredoxin domain
MRAGRGWPRLWVALAATAAIVGTLGWFSYDSRVPSTYSVTDMGYPDLGGGPSGKHPSGHSISVSNITGDTAGPPEIDVTLTARHETFKLASGEVVTGYTLDHQSPGPVIRVTQNDLVQVTLVNESVAGGITLHWHGVAVPNAFDGVAGVTQDAVPPGGQFTYRFRPKFAGTYWYHSHQVSHEQVQDGLFGVLVVDPDAASSDAATDVIAPVHTYDGRRTIAGRSGTQRVDATAGTPVRVRIINTDNGPMTVSVSGAAYRVVAHDGRDINSPPEVADASVVLAGGGRVDLTVRVPDSGMAVRVDLGGGAVLALGPATATVPPKQTAAGTVDFLTYGSPAPIGFDPSWPQRRFDYKIGRRPGFVDGMPGVWWSINGRLFPDIPMFMVNEGDVVIFTIVNASGEVHPMHLHGHHLVVLQRDGEHATGSPWWTDTLDVENGATYVVAFLANNPGIWMDHCHNLPHAAEGLVAHLHYAGVDEPFRVGGSANNSPE